MGLLTTAEKDQMPLDILQKHEDWAEVVTVKSSETFSETDELGATLDSTVTYAQETLDAIVHDAGVVKKGGAGVNQDYKKFLMNGITEHTRFVVFIHKNNIETVDAYDLINIRGKDYYIEDYSEGRFEFYILAGEKHEV